MIRAFTKHLLVRYIISGGTAATVDLSLLYVFNFILGMNYLLAATLAFALAFSVSFVLQKFWTFKDVSTEGIHKQTFIYLGTSLFGLILNTLLMYVFVSFFHINVIVAQILAGGLVACCTFFISRDFVFKNRGEHTNIRITHESTNGYE